MGQDGTEDGGGTGRVARFAAGASVPESVRHRAVPLILDTLAVLVAGDGEAPVRRLAGTLPEAGGPDGVSCFRGGRNLRPDDAALLFGMAAHVLDYDDVSMLAMCHPSAPVLAALLATPARGCTGQRFIDAFAIGTEVLIRLGEAMGFRHYALGFHATATLGSLGAAVACARLLGLDADATGNAVAIAASLAGGLRRNFGSDVKALHVGIAASNGLKAAQWAAAGLRGSAVALEHGGFLHAFSGGDADRFTGALGAPFALETPGFEQKRYPCCYMLHKPIEATLILRRAHRLTLEDVDAACVEMPPGGSAPLIHPIPQSGLAALFSGPYAVAAALQDGRIDLASFSDAAVARPEVRRRLRHVELVEREGDVLCGAQIAAAPVQVRLMLRDGRTVSHSITAAPGSPQDPLTVGQLRAKWCDALGRAARGPVGTVAERLFDEGLTLATHAEVAPWLDRLKAV